MTEGAAVFTMMRNFGSSLFISLAVLVFVRSSSISYAQLVEFVSPYRPLLYYQSLPVTGILRRLRA